MRGSWSPAPGSSGRTSRTGWRPTGAYPSCWTRCSRRLIGDRPPELARHELAGHEGVVAVAEALGGGDLHARVAGVANHLADDDTRTRCASSTPPRHAWAPRAAAVGGAPTEEAAVDPAELYGAAS